MADPDLSGLIGLMGTVVVVKAISEMTPGMKKTKYKKKKGETQWL